MSSKNLNQSAPNAGVSPNLPLSPSTHYRPASCALVVSPQSSVASTLPTPYVLGSQPTRHANYSACIAKDSSSTPVTPRLPAVGTRLEERMKRRLNLAEEALHEVRRNNKMMHMWPLVALLIFGVVNSVLAQAANMKQRWAESSVAVLLRTIFSVVSFLLTWILFCQYAFGKMEEASRRARELKAFVRDLRYFIGHHNSNPSIANQPETKAMAAQYELRFYMIMNDKIETVKSSLESENILKRWKTAVAIEKDIDQTECSIV